VSYSTVCPIYLLDGAHRGPALHLRERGVSCTATPAFGDIDNDGLPEVVAVYIDGGVFRLKAFEHDGTLKWTNTTDGASASQFYRESGAIAIHDLDADGDAEIVFNHEVYDHEGKLLWEKINPNPGELEATTAADLDGDGKLEVITGHSAYRWDGTQVLRELPDDHLASRSRRSATSTTTPTRRFSSPPARACGWSSTPARSSGARPRRPACPPAPTSCGSAPAPIHDFDGDLKPEWASSSRPPTP
jgi:hypothetical protein